MLIPVMLENTSRHHSNLVHTFLVVLYKEYLTFAVSAQSDLSCKLSVSQRTNGWMDGWMDGRMDGRTAERKDGRTGGWIDGRMDGWMDGWTDDGYIYVWMDGWIDRWMDGLID